MPKPPALCKKCGVAPKMTAHHRCVECWYLTQPMPEQVGDCSRARRRMLSSLTALPDGHPLREAGWSRLPERTWPAGRRWCASCQRFRRLADCSGSRCKPCAWQASHEGNVQRTYGLGPGQYDEMFTAQDGRCAICRNRQLSKALAVHHDHRTKSVVALLCGRCNQDVVGAAWDSPDLLIRAWAVQVGGWPAAAGVLRWQAGEAPFPADLLAHLTPA